MIQVLIDEIDLPVIVDAGIGKPSQACEAMEMGAAAIMANTAIATAGIYLIWQRLLSLQFRLAEKHILLEWEEFLQEVEAHQIR